jgi:exopolyphosphatase/guanosine-5'-triphosphate,3'-diphosphate pyrophosphatase
MTAGELDQREAAVHAVIDIGTNSFHLVVARGLADGGFEVITTEKEMVRLGQGSGEMKQLADDAIDRGVAALGRMAAVAATHGADVTAVATSATREAANRRVFIDRVRAETGVEIEVISGVEEARLIHLGVLQALPVYDQRLLLVDIGGGSTEILVGEGSKVIGARSTKLGAIRLTERFFADPNKKVTGKAMKKCRSFVANNLAAVAHDLAPYGHDIAIGSSGTIGAIASMIAARRDENPNDVNGVAFTADELERLVDDLAGTTVEDRRGFPGLDAKRTDIIVGGAVLLSGVFEALGVESMTVSGYALREGVLFDRFADDGERSRRRLRDLRRSNVVRLAGQLDPDADHAETAARLATSIFDQTVGRHGLDDQARELLELAALIHNVGLFISHAAHHKHTYYVVRHSEQLTGFSERERELLALIARYHRRSHPNPGKHAEFAALSPDDQHLIRVLAGMLRIGIGLDRSHRGLVSGVSVGSGEGDTGKRLVITPDAPADADISLEVYSAQERADLLAEALDVEVEVVAERRGSRPDRRSS